jgi:nucleotide-binding universal stress UspA family protein
MPRIIVAYDGTPQAEDALALGHALSELVGGPIALAHVHRADPQDRSPSASVVGREDFLRRESERMLARASDSLGAASVSPRALAGTTTASALRELAEDEHAELIVFGSAPSGPSGRVHPGSAARRLLHSAHCAVAFAPEGFRKHEWSAPAAVAVVEDDAEGSARDTAEALAAHTGGSVASSPEGDADLLVVGSRSDAPAGALMTSAAAEQRIQAARAPVIVVARGVALGSELAGARAA